MVAERGVKGQEHIVISMPPALDPLNSLAQLGAIARAIALYYLYLQSIPHLVQVELLPP